VALSCELGPMVATILVRRICFRAEYRQTWRSAPKN
jgi:hypothetical protein